ncbi:hypothetical protein M0805_009594 [Coniferiporia weirii]|nr:hypothetical protein M0805_009594 [Coniferiporia weirii]
MGTIISISTSYATLLKPNRSGPLSGANNVSRDLSHPEDDCEDAPSDLADTRGPLVPADSSSQQDDRPAVTQIPSPNQRHGVSNTMPTMEQGTSCGRQDETAASLLFVSRTSEDSLRKVLSKLGHLDLTGRVVSESTVMKAHGGYCDIFIGNLSPVLPGHASRIKVAIKRLRIHLHDDRDFTKFLVKEMHVWSKLDHPNVLPFKGYVLEDTYPSLISEWIENGTVTDFLEKNTGIDIRLVILGIAKGLEYLHSRDVIHSDLKADNVLIGRSGQPLICDFGISRMITSSQTLSSAHDGSVRGSTRWMSVELFGIDSDVDPIHTKASDIWAFGMTVYEVITQQRPYAHLKADQRVILAIIRGELPTRPVSIGEKSSTLGMIWTICEDCWKTDPDDRVAIDEIISRLNQTRDSAPTCLRAPNGAQVEQSLQSRLPIESAELETSASPQSHTLYPAIYPALEFAVSILLHNLVSRTPTSVPIAGPPPLIPHVMCFEDKPVNSPAPIVAAPLPKRSLSFRRKRQIRPDLSLPEVGMTLPDQGLNLDSSSVFSQRPWSDTTKVDASLADNPSSRNPTRVEFGFPLTNRCIGSTRDRVRFRDKGESVDSNVDPSRGQGHFSNRYTDHNPSIRVQDALPDTIYLGLPKGSGTRPVHDCNQDRQLGATGESIGARSSARLNPVSAYVKMSVARIAQQQQQIQQR